LLGKSEGKTPRARPRVRWEDNIKMGLTKLGCGAWTEFIWLKIWDKMWALVNEVMNLRVQQYAGYFLTS